MARIDFDHDHVYCSPEHVEQFFRTEEGFSASSNPNNEEIKRFIAEASDELDRKTRRSWRENRVVDEYHDFDTAYHWGSGRSVMLNQLDVITPFESSEGDAIELYDGDGWHDWVADNSKQEGRDEDYWFDPSMGQLFIYKRFTWRRRAQIRISYRYGREVQSENPDGVPDDIPRDVRQACAKLVAIHLIESDQYSQLVPGGEGGMSPGQAVSNWRADIFGDGQTKGFVERHKQTPAIIDEY